MATNFAVPGNNVSTTVGTAYSGTGGFPKSLIVASGTAFPTITGSQTVTVTVCQVAFAYSPTATSANYTIYSVTGISISGTTLTLGGVLEGTNDRAYAVGDIVEVRVTAGTLSSVYAAVNNLEYNSTSVTVSTGGNLSASAYGTTQVCVNTSNITLVLPAPVAGSVIGFRMGWTMTKLVTIQGASGALIDGSNTRVMWANETALLGNDGTNWFKISGKTIPMFCAMYISSNGTITSAPNTGYLPLTDTQTDNTGLMADPTTNHRVNIVRSSSYAVVAQMTILNTAANGFYSVYSAKNRTSVIGGSTTPPVAAGNNPSFQSAGVGSCLAGDYLEIEWIQSSGVNETVFAGIGQTQLLVQEIVGW